jgi:hypothetical protein
MEVHSIMHSSREFGKLGERSLLAIRSNDSPPAESEGHAPHSSIFTDLFAENELSFSAEVFGFQTDIADFAGLAHDFSESLHPTKLSC